MLNFFRNVKFSNYRKFSLYTFPLLILLTAEFFIYQSIFFMPVSVNGTDFMARKRVTVWDFLSTTNNTPKYGNLLDVQKKILRVGKGNTPVIKVNGIPRSFGYYLKPNDEIQTFTGSNKTEPLAKERRYLEKPVENYGWGSFIIIERKGKLGIKEVVMGKISKKVVREKIIAHPIPTGISRVDIRKRKVVALTFDDGPSIYTKRVLKILDKFNVKATFFVLGRNVVKYPKYVYRIRKHGHVIGNHTFNHIYMQKASAKVIRAELKRTDQVINKYAHVKTKWVRPPGGSLRQAVVNFVVMGGKNISLWNIDTTDWKRPSPKVIRSRVISALQPGQVILMHDGGGNRENTVAALPDMIRQIKRRHYRFATLDELYSSFRPYD